MSEFRSFRASPFVGPIIAASTATDGSMNYEQISEGSLENCSVHLPSSTREVSSSDLTFADDLSTHAAK